jgi:hypothetical protein
MCKSFLYLRCIAWTGAIGRNAGLTKPQPASSGCHHDPAPDMSFAELLQYQFITGSDYA